MDIFKIARTQITPPTTGTKKTSEGNKDRDPQQGGQGAQQGREEPVSEEEARLAAEKLKNSPHFITNALTIETREFDGKYFLDIFDPQRRKIKSIGGVGIRAILSSYKSTNTDSNARILDRRI